MPFDSCLDAIQQAAGKPLSDREVADLYRELGRRKRQIEKERAGASAEETLEQAAADLGNDMTLAALIEKRNAALNLRKRLEAVNYITTRFADKPAEGVEALLVGTNRPRQGARASVAAEQHALAGKYLGGFVADVERIGPAHWNLFVSGELDRDIARALWALDNEDATPFRGRKEAGEIATVVRKWQDAARVDANNAGAWIGKLPGYIVRQSHDIYRIRGAGFERWKADILPKLDLARTLPEGQSLDEFLAAVYDGLSSGVHLRATEPGDKAGGFKGPGNLAKRVSAERVLHFKDADAWVDYNAAYGSGNLREAVLAGLERQAQSTALMRTLGTNPEATLAAVYGEVEKSLRGNPEQLAGFRSAQDWLDNRLAEVDGRTRIPVNKTLARVASNVRAWESMARLGGAVLSAFSDLPIYASEMRYQGRSMLGGLADGIGGLLKGRGSKEQQQILAKIGVFFDSMRGEITSRFSAHDDLGGRMSRGMQLFFKFNGLNWWTDTMRASAALSMSHRLALVAGDAWGALEPDLRRVLSLYGIDEGKWDIVRRGSIDHADGRAYVTPEGVTALPDDAFASYLGARGVNATAARVRELRSEVESQLRQYLLDRTSYAVIEPDARTRAIMRRGTRPGTVEGEFLRFVGQFKAFPIAVLQKTVGREIYGRGADTFAQAMRNGNGELAGLAQLMVWTTLFGYGSMVAKDLVKGRTPRQPNDPNTWAAAMAQGGGMGIYGDFLWGEHNRFGGDVVASLAGPAIGTAADAVALWQRFRHGDDVAASAFRTALNNTPFLNLFYTRIALDYLFLYRVQESLNPGYLRRMERRVQTENEQQFIVRPSQVVR